MLDPGTQRTLSITSYSPLTRCGFVPDLTQTMTVSAEQSRSPVIDCRFLHFIRANTGEPDRQYLVGTDGTEAGTTIFLNESPFLSRATFKQNVIFADSAENTGFLWTNGAKRSLAPLSWNTDAAIDTRLDQGQLFGLFEDGTNDVRVRIARTPERALAPFANLPSATSGFEYTSIHATDTHVVVVSKRGNPVGYQAHLIRRNAPGSIEGPIDIPEAIAEANTRVGNTKYGTRLDEKSGEAVLHTFDTVSGSVLQWDLPETNVQDLSVWEQEDAERLILGAKYLRGDNESCASIHEFESGSWRELRDFCDDHTDVTVSGWSVDGEHLQVVAAAESGPLIPPNEALVVMRDVGSAASRPTVIPQDHFEGRVVDHIATYSGGFFYTWEERQEGCPSMGRWTCLYRGRLYFFNLTSSLLEVRKVFDGLFQSDLIYSPPIVSRHGPASDSVIFASARSDTDRMLGRSDGTVSGTRLFFDITPKTKGSAYFSEVPEYE